MKIAADVQRALRGWQERTVKRLGPDGFRQLLNDGTVQAILDQAIQLQLARDARVDANKEALHVIVKDRKYTEGDRQALEGYTGWGGIPQEELEQLGLGELTPQDEYYTPPKIAAGIGRSIAPLLPGLAGRDGRIKALEPSAGVGRLITGISSATDIPIDWTAVELSPISAKILGVLHPEVEIHQVPFEQWVVEYATKMQGQFNLVACNPPYYGRGPSQSLDKDLKYRYADNFSYFLRRGLELLAPGGLGVFIIPKNFLLAPKYSDLRRLIMIRYRLCAAFKLPRNAFQAVNMKTYVMIYRARGGEVSEATPEELAILDGLYDEAHPDHVLKFDFAGDLEFPVMTPECSACELGEPESCEYAQAPTGSAIEAARAFGHRIATLRSSVDAGEARARDLWRELKRDLARFRKSQYLVKHSGKSNPWAWEDLRRLNDEGVATYLSAFDESGKAVPWLVEQPELPYRGAPNSVVDQATWLYRHNHEQPIHTTELLALHRKAGGKQELGELLEHLLGNGWVLARADVLEPNESYYSGNLLEKLQYLQITPRTAAQAEELHYLTPPIPVEDIELDPRSGWVPAEVLSQWASEMFGREVELERRGGDIKIISSEGRDELRPLLAWLNHRSFSPRSAPDISPEPGDEHLAGVELNRVLWGRHWTRYFQAWVGAEASRRFSVTDAYNQAVRGFRCRPDYPTGPLEIPRWGDAIKLHPFQVASARRLLDRGGGLLALDTGLGKTFVGLAVLAAARSRGWAKRPVVVVPKALAWKWFDAFQTALPDYRVTVIGSHRYRRMSGKRYKELRALYDAGKMTKAQLEVHLVTSRTDTPDERRDKWAGLAAAAYDAVIVTTNAMEETRVSDRLVDSYMQHSAVARAARASKKFEPPQGKSDGPVWNADFLIVDEAARFKNLWTPEVKLKYMGCPPPSRRALHLDLRAHATRKANKRGAGVVLLSATPAKNSPVELYNLGHIIDPDLWEKAGIHHASQFAARYIDIDSVPTLCPDLDVKVHQAVVGFKHMDELQGLLCRFSEFKTASDLDTDLQLPTPRRHVVEVELDKRQQAKYRMYLRNLPTELENPCGALAILVKLGLVAVHGNLDEGYTWDHYDGVDPRSPKFDAIASHVVAITNCGHLVFVQNHAAQRWLQQMLVTAGVPEDRIAILNAKVPSGELKRIAQGFNGTDPLLGVKYDVLIVNEVAYEGLDLQTRTCAVHHADLPWNSAELQQRIGRAIRPGATCEVVEVFYYVALGSTDKHRLAMIDGKARWDKDINRGDEWIRNPLAASFSEPLEVLVSLAGDDASVEIIEKARARQKKVARHKALVAANRLVYRAAARYRDVREAGSRGRLAGVRLKQAEALMDEVRAIDAKVWPWARWLDAIRDVMPLVPSDGSAPVFEGLRIARLARKGELEAFEFGRTGFKDGRNVIGMRRAGEGVWTALSDEQVSNFKLRPRHFPGETEVEWPAEIGDVVADIRGRLGELETTPWTELFGWRYASANFIERVWPQVAKVVTKELRRDKHHAFPAMSDGQLNLVRGTALIDADLIPPTSAGWRVFLDEIWTLEGVPRGEIEKVANAWWGRKLPERSS